MENQDQDSDSFCSQDFAIRNMFQDAGLNDPMPSASNESGNITLPSLPVPDIGPTDQEDKVKNLLEATRPLTELNASLNLMAKEINEGTYRPCWITKIKFLPDIYLRGEKDERDRINREARQLASNAFNKYKAESLAFLGKEIQATKRAIDSALTTARSFNTKERRQLSRGRQKQGDTRCGRQPTTERKLPIPPTPLHTKRRKRKQQKRERQRLRHSKILITFFQDPSSTAGVTLFPKKGRSLVAKVVT